MPSRRVAGKSPLPPAPFYVHPCPIRGLQTLGYSCLLRATCPLHCGCGVVCPHRCVRGSRGPSGDVWSTYRHSPYSLTYPRVTNPRLLLWSGSATLSATCGVVWSVLIRGLYSPLWLCGLSLLAGCVCLRRVACQPAAGVWCGVVGGASAWVQAVCVPAVWGCAGRVACGRGVSLRSAGVCAGDERRSRSTGVTGGL